jgi:hypothetical protein
VVLGEAEGEDRAEQRVQHASAEEVVVEELESNRFAQLMPCRLLCMSSSEQVVPVVQLEVLLLAQTVWPVETARWQRIIRIHQQQASLQLLEVAEEDREDFRQVRAVEEVAEEVEVKA